MWSAPRTRFVWTLGVLLLVGCVPPRELRLPDVRQTTDYTCGPSALQAVLAYYGEETSEAELAKEMGATPSDGVPPEAIVRVARAHGLSPELRENLHIADLAHAVRRGIPVLVALQAWPDAPIADYSQVWTEGHYVVVLAVERDRLIFEDPSIWGSRGVLSHAEFNRRWHDQDGDRRWHHLGIVLAAPVGRRPAPPYLHID